MGKFPFASIFRWPVLAALLGVTLIAAFFLVPVRLRVINGFPGKKLAQSRLLATVFLLKEGYFGKVREIDLVYTSKPQYSWQIIDGRDSRLLQSVDLKQDGRRLAIKVYYDPLKIDQILSEKNLIERDFYALVCYGFQKKLGKDGCVKKAQDFILWKEKFGFGALFELIRARLPGFSLAKKAYAACSGTILCGEWVSTCTCSDATEARRLG